MEQSKQACNNSNNKDKITCGRPLPLGTENTPITWEEYSSNLMSKRVLVDRPGRPSNLEVRILILQHPLVSQIVAKPPKRAGTCRRYELTHMQVHMHIRIERERERETDV